MTDQPIRNRMLTVTNLTIATRHKTLVDQVSFTLDQGERLGFIGSSGSGKSLTALALMGLLPPNLRTEGTITLGDDPTNLLTLKDRGMQAIRGASIAMVFQEPMSALNPRMSIGDQVAEALTIHGTPKHEAQARALELLASVNLPDLPAIAKRTARELSGGQRQRVLIAIALANEPDVLIADEPTTALDATTQKKVLNLISKHIIARNTALLFISHDLAVTSQLCERVHVLAHGKTVEEAAIPDIFFTQHQPETRQLVANAYELTKPCPHQPDPKEDVPVVSFAQVHRYYNDNKTITNVLEDINFNIYEGERVGIVGESGSGKSTILRIIAGLNRQTSGTVSVGRRVQMVFQDPAGSLNPRMRIGKSIMEPLHYLPGESLSEKAKQQAMYTMLEAVGLQASDSTRYPHEFSGGQRQRIAIARALVSTPDILLADEPVSALDTQTRTEVLDLIDRLVAEHGLTLMYVSHDLQIVRRLCNTAIVLQNGVIVEKGLVKDVIDNPQHPYTQSLLDAVLPLPQIAS